MELWITTLSSANIVAALISECNILYLILRPGEVFAEK